MNGGPPCAILHEVLENLDLRDNHVTLAPGRTGYDHGLSYGANEETAFLPVLACREKKLLGMLGKPTLIPSIDPQGVWVRNRSLDST